MRAARYLAIVGGWDAAVTFCRPLHDDIGKPSGWLKVSSDPTDPRLLQRTLPGLGRR